LSTWFSRALIGLEFSTQTDKKNYKITNKQNTRKHKKVKTNENPKEKN